MFHGVNILANITVLVKVRSNYNRCSDVSCIAYRVC